jgi:hypothetical protein
MPPVLMIVIALHILAGVFWIGSSIVLAINGIGSVRWFRGQMVAATVAVFAGGGLWSMLHPGGAMGRPEMTLAAGAVAAIVAAGVQGALVGGSVRRLRSGLLAEAVAQRKMALGQRIAAGLLTFTLITMVAARYV